MNHHYRDIIDRIDGAPLWWDEHAVPRYCEFAPSEVANIYCDEVVLLDIQCQSCGTHFDVALSSGHMDRGVSALRRKQAGGVDDDENNFKQAWREMSLAYAVLEGVIHYGDPPNAGCCPAGPTMNSIPYRVREFWVTAPWVRGVGRAWTRVEALERDIDCEWAKV